MKPIGAAACVFVFVAVFFAAPLIAAVSLCAMPCCHEDAAPRITAGCSECEIQASDVTAAKAMRTTAPPVRTVIAVAVVATPLAPTVAAPVARHTASPPGTAPPLHVLNSVFRI